jgi:hypothetical protein
MDKKEEIKKLKHRKLFFEIWLKYYLDNDNEC